MYYPIHCSLKKNSQTIHPGTLIVFYILLIHTDNAKVSFVLKKICQPGGAAINFSKIAQNQNQTALLLRKNLLLPKTSASKICLRCTVLKL